MVVIRYEGPKGGPGMPEMLTPTSAIMGAGLGNDCALITDGRFRWEGGARRLIVCRTGAGRVLGWVCSPHIGSADSCLAPASVGWCLPCSAAAAPTVL